jgi:thiamine biosynthesis lipoprotein
MGTTYSIKIVYDSVIFSESKFTSLKSSVDSILTDINRQMSTYIEDSELSQFNNLDDSAWFPVSSDFAYVLERSIELGRLTGGALDITVGPLVNLWGFGPVNKGRSIPPADKINERLKTTGLDYLRVDTSLSRIRKYKTGIYCDLSSTAKGYAVDKIAGYLSDLNWDNYLVEIGGEVKAHGKNQKREYWKIGIAEPGSVSEPFYVVSLNNLAMATSGDYWNFFEQDGVKYSHTIDPRTGYPVKHDLASVTIVSESCLQADGLATAINVLGPEDGYLFADQNGIAAYFIIRNHENYLTEQTPQFDSMTKQERKD